MKLRGRKFQVETVGSNTELVAKVEHLIRDATCRGIQYGYADAITALVRCGGQLEKLLLSSTVSVTKVTGNTARERKRLLRY